MTVGGKKERKIVVVLLTLITCSFFILLWAIICANQTTSTLSLIAKLRSALTSSLDKGEKERKRRAQFPVCLSVTPNYICNFITNGPSLHFSSCILPLRLSFPFAPLCNPHTATRDPVDREWKQSGHICRWSRKKRMHNKDSAIWPNRAQGYGVHRYKASKDCQPKGDYLTTGIHGRNLFKVFFSQEWTLFLSQRIPPLFLLHHSRPALRYFSIDDFAHGLILFVCKVHLCDVWVCEL